VSTVEQLKTERGIRRAIAGAAGYPPGIILKSNPDAATGPEGLWPGGSGGALILTG